MLAETVPITLLLEAVSIPIVYSIAIATGIHSAKKGANCST